MTSARATLLRIKVTNSFHG